MAYYSKPKANEHPPASSLDTSSGDFHENLFISQWRNSISTQSKLSFYRQVKISFGEEAYFQLSNRSYRLQIAKLRSSSHDLTIEKGRYGQIPIDLSRKFCRFCCSNDNNTMINFEYLPRHEVPILESEEHVLTECPAYHSIRVALPDSLKVKSLLMLKEFGIIMSSIHMKEFRRYLLACYKLRNHNSSSNL